MQRNSERVLRKQSEIDFTYVLRDKIFENIILFKIFRLYVLKMKTSFLRFCLSINKQMTIERGLEVYNDK